MCGIFAVFGYHVDTKTLRETAVACGRKIRHRGPDWSGVKCYGNSVALAHERLAIVDVVHGAQPLLNKDKTAALCVNGEIYNHEEIREQHVPEYNFQTKSDCECILPLYEKYGSEDFLSHLDGMFAFVLYDDRNGNFIVARDHMGICPLYQGWGADGSRWFASEMKALIDNCVKIELFPPGHVLRSKGYGGESLDQFYNPRWYSTSYVPTEAVDYEKLRISFEKAVHKRLMSDVPYGVLLSGGLDSSLVASIAARYCAKKAEEGEYSWSPKLHSFSIGLVGSPDLKAASEVAKMIGTIHHEFTFTVEDGLDALRDVIYHLETFDVTTIRASTPMFLLSRKIKAMGVKMVLSGEGADEILGGYLYFSKSPSGEALHKETVDRVKNLHTADVLRANKSTMAWGLEVRVPFLDKDYMDVAMDIAPEEKLHKAGRIEKYVMRKAFDVPSDPYLPDSVLWRQKEQFSDGVGYSWIDSLKSVSDAKVSAEELKDAAAKFPVLTPTTKEAYFYRTVFEELFPKESALQTVVKWVPRTDWGCSADPSGRAQGVHVAAY